MKNKQPFQGGGFMESRREILKLALDVGEKAGRFLRRHFRAKRIVARKKGEDLLTPADRESEELIRAELEKKDPSSGICGEEYGISRPKAANWWCLDPLDGTTNFIRGIPFFSVSIAYFENGAPVVGVVVEPVHEIVYTAIKGRGAFVQGRPIAGDRQIQFKKGESPVLLYTLNVGYRVKPPAWIGRRLSHAKLRNLGSMALQLCYVAHGTLDYCVSDRAHLWDIAAGALVLQESGGKLVDFDRKPIFPLHHPWSHVSKKRLPFIAMKP